MKTYKITIFGVKETTKMIAEYLHNQGIKVDLIVSIDSSFVEKHRISNFMALEATAKSIAADYYGAKDYTLETLEDGFFQKNKFEIGIVYGWQRLIPEGVIGQFSTGLFGFHASPELLPKGRGRSPLNWGIILGKTVLYNHFFKYVAAADAGDIYSVTSFEITPHDTILTLLYKSILIAKREIIKLIHDANAGTLKLKPQQGETYSFAKRTAADGLIDFNTHSTNEIINLIRGVTTPFPGAFCYTSEGKKIIVWEAWAFDHLIDFSSYIPGEVIDNLYDMPIIKTNDGSIILKNYEGAGLLPHDRLGCMP